MAFLSPRLFCKITNPFTLSLRRQADLCLPIAGIIGVSFTERKLGLRLHVYVVRI